MNWDVLAINKIFVHIFSPDQVEYMSPFYGVEVRD